LADIGLHGMTTDIITQALLGDRSQDGLASYLHKPGDDRKCYDIDSSLGKYTISVNCVVL